VKKALPWIIAVALVIGCLALLDRSCGGPDAAYWIARADYDQAVADMEDGLQQAFAIIAEKDKVIAAKGLEIAAILANAPVPSPEEKAKDTYISDLEEQIAAFESIGDTANALMSAKEEITAWAEKFNLAERRHQDSLSALNNAWRVKFDAQVSISETWKKAFEDEHALRLTCDSLRLDLEGQAGRGKFWKPVAITEAVVIAALAIFGK
jgi:N-methylhydantoinase B/oxoprolinase/acetone carboxylase alpha subunit